MDEIAPSLTLQNAPPERASSEGAMSDKPQFLMLSGYHDYRSPRKADVHFIAKELKAYGRVYFVSTRFSRISMLREDPRHALNQRANRIEIYDGVNCYLWRTPVHPVGLPKALRPLERLIFAGYKLQLPQAIKRMIRASNVIFVESGINIIFARLIKRLNPTCKLIYLAEDSLGTIHQAETIKNALREHASAFDAARIVSPHINSEIPDQMPRYYIPHGIEKQTFAVIGDTPYEPGTQNAVSVGSMLFDPEFFNIAGALFPSITFHVIGSGHTQPARNNVIFYPEMPFAKTLPYLKHSDFAIAPYNEKVAAYLTHSSMKLMQYNFLGIPAVCPDLIAASSFGRFGYKHGDAESIRRAIYEALSAKKIEPQKHIGWAEVTAQLLGIARTEKAR